MRELLGPPAAPNLVSSLLPYTLPCQFPTGNPNAPGPHNGRAWGTVGVSRSHRDDYH